MSEMYGSNFHLTIILVYQLINRWLSGTSVRSLAVETLPRDGTTSFLLTMVVMKSLPDSAKSHVMQAAEQ